MNKMPDATTLLDWAYASRPASGQSVSGDLHLVQPHAKGLGAAAAIDMLRRSADRGLNDARWLRDTQGRERLLAEMVRQAAERFRDRAAAG